MKQIVYRGKFRAVEVSQIEFPRGVPVPVKHQLAAKLLAMKGFEEYVPVVAEPEVAVAASEPAPEPVTPVEEEKPVKESYLDNLWARL